MRLFVTGGTGFIGTHLVKRLVAEGHEVMALVRSAQKAAALEALGVCVVPGDLGVFARDGFHLDPVDGVIHLAGVVAAPSPEQYEAINYTAVVHLKEWLEAQDWKPKRLLFCSSLAAAGPSPLDRPLTESDPLAPLEAYGEAKARAEAALADCSFPVTCFRPPPVFGPGDAAFRPVFAAAARGVGIRITGPSQRLSWVYVDDLVEAIVVMAEDAREGSYVYFTASEERVDQDQLWDALRKALNRRILQIPVPGPALGAAATVASVASKLFGFRNQLDHKQVAQIRSPAFLCSSDRLTRDLGWTAKVGFDEAIRKTAEGYRKIGWI